jgi:hypothetical protein
MKLINTFLFLTILMACQNSEIPKYMVTPLNENYAKDSIKYIYQDNYSGANLILIDTLESLLFHNFKPIHGDSENHSDLLNGVLNSAHFSFENVDSFFDYFNNEEGIQLIMIAVNKDVVTDKRLFEVMEKIKTLENVFVCGVRRITAEEKVLVSTLNKN